MNITSNPTSGLTAPQGVAVLIVASEPGRALLDVIEPLVRAGAPAIVVVDDGSSPARKWVLDRIGMEPTVHLLRHARPLGRGAACKTGMQYVAEHLRHYTGIVTTAPDPRYGPEDVVRLMRALHGAPRLVIVGAAFCGQQQDQSGDDRPSRSLQSRILGVLFHAVTRISLTDVQTPLRAIPTELLPLLLKVPGEEYDYEFGMLLHIARCGYPMAEHAVFGAPRPSSMSGGFPSWPGWLNIVRALLRSKPAASRSEEQGTEFAASSNDAQTRPRASKTQQTR